MSERGSSKLIENVARLAAVSWSDVSRMELGPVRLEIVMSGATQMGVPWFAFDVGKGISVVLFGPGGQTAFAICWSVGLVFV